jgi:hypothetical protein
MRVAIIVMAAMLLFGELGWMSGRRKGHDDAMKAEIDYLQLRLDTEKLRTRRLTTQLNRPLQFQVAGPLLP